MKKFAFLLVSSLVVSAHADFVDGFESASFSGPNGTSIVSAVNWTLVNASSPVGSTSFFDGTSSVFGANAGSHYVAANFNSGAGASAINNFMMTPTLSLNNGDTFSFYTRTASGFYPDRLIVKMSTAGASTAVGSFTSTLLTINPGLATGTAYPTAWTQYTVTISGLSGLTSGRLAFNYNVTDGGASGENSDYIGIDDVAYTQAVPEPATMAALGLGAVAMLRRRKR